MASTRSLLDSTIMQKIVVAISGLAIVLFLIAHLAGNLLIYAGPIAFNKYAQGLRDLGALLWIMRIGMLAAFVAHIVLTIRLKMRNSEARPKGYNALQAQNSTMYSRSMVLSGLTILSFVLFHLLHFTWGKIQPQFASDTFMLADGRMVHNAYTMTVAGFKVVWISILYLIAVSVVFLHLLHAIQSAFQTLGFNHPRYRPLVMNICTGLSFILWAGFVSIPISVMLGRVQ